jgi:UDP-2-acetamido-3-amino-2,3-dideoxy-glucuronate N-acetyltransferase
MASSKLSQDVIQIVSDILMMPPGGITAETRQSEVEAWDSVQHLIIIMTLEERYSLRLAIDNSSDQVSVGEIARLVEQKILANDGATVRDQDNKDFSVGRPLLASHVLPPQTRAISGLQGRRVSEEIADQGIIIGPSVIGKSCMIAHDAIIGHPMRSTVGQTNSFYQSSGATIGDRCVLRAGTIIYENSIIGNDVQFGHHAMVRENVIMGDRCMVGGSATVMQDVRMGQNVRLMDQVVICEEAELANDIFVGPGVMMTGGRKMLGALTAAGIVSAEEAKLRESLTQKGQTVRIGNRVRIGTNAVILAGVTLADDCVVGAGSVVGINVPSGHLAIGNPAKIMRLPKSFA